jgi:hypothetical protein
MPVHVEEMSTEVTALDGELPLTESQIERLVQIILKRLDEKQRAARQSQEAVSLKRGAAPPARIGG